MNLELFINTVNHCLVAISLSTLCTCAWLVVSGLIFQFMHDWLSNINGWRYSCDVPTQQYNRNASEEIKDSLDFASCGKYFCYCRNFWEYAWRAQNNRNHFGRRNITWSNWHSSVYIKILSIMYETRNGFTLLIGANNSRWDRSFFPSRSQKVFESSFVEALI